MGLKLPQAIDYGNRPSLEVNRLDKPGTGGVVLAEALSSAVSQFDGVMKEKKAKDDRLTYALTRNELQIAAIETEALFDEDQDWATTDDRFTEAFTKRREELTARAIEKGLSHSDAAILGAEGDLMLAQGRVSVGGSANKIRVGQGVARFKEGMAAARIALDTKTSGDARNGVILGQLDAIDAAEEDGYLKPEEAQAYREKMTQDFALGSLDAMSDRELIDKINRALAYRTGFAPDFGEYSDFIVAASEEHGLPPELIFAQMSTESSGNPNAKSGAQGDPTGLMQMGRDAALDMGVTDRTDPEQSINGGSKYMAEMFRVFDGDKAKTLAAYNLGPGKLKKIIAKYGEDGWMARIREKDFDPTQETANYIDKLLPVWENAGKIKTDGKNATGIGGLTAEDIRNGKGTGSVADFVHTDLLTKRYDAAVKRQDEDFSREEAQAGLDIATDLFPESHEDIMKWGKENLTGMAREYFETNAEQANASKTAIQLRKNFETKDEAKKAINASTLEAPFNKDMIDTTAWTELSNADQMEIKGAIEAKRKDLHHAPDGQTHLTSWNDGLASMEEWKNLPNYPPDGAVEGDASWEAKSNANLKEWRWAGALDRNTQSSMLDIQRVLKENESKALDIGKDAPGLVQSTLKLNKYAGATGTDDRAALQEHLELELIRRATVMGNTFKPPRELTPNELRKVWAEMQTITGDYGLNDWVPWNQWDNKKLIEMSPEDKEIAELDVTPAMASDPGSLMSAGTYGELGSGKVLTIVEGGELTKLQYLNAMQRIQLGLKQGDKDVSHNEKNIRRAYWAQQNGYSTEEVNRRLMGK